MKQIRRVLNSVGVLGASRVLIDQVVDSLHERRLGIDTGGLVPIEALVDDWEGCHDYFPTSFATFRRAMRYVSFRPHVDVFVDYGAGRGRVLAMAARYPFRRIIGVEISHELSESARANVARCGAGLRCKDIEIWTGRAQAFPLPAEASVVFLYNPFHGPILRQVLENIRSSLSRHPRKIQIIYNNPKHFQSMHYEYPWIIETFQFSRRHPVCIYEAVLR